MDPKEVFKQMFEEAAVETGLDLKKTSTELAAYMDERLTQLRLNVGQPGFEKSLISERNSVAMEAGLEISEVAHSLDQRIIGAIGGALRVAAMFVA